MKCIWPQYEAMREFQPDAMVCNRPKEELRAPDRANVDLMNKVQSYYANRFIYEPDDKDVWRHHYGVKDAFRGDCDDLAWTLLEALLHEGWPREHLWAVITGTNMSHMVAVAETNDGTRYVVADSLRMIPHPVDRSEFDLRVIMNMARLGMVGLHDLKEY